MLALKEFKRLIPMNRIWPHEGDVTVLMGKESDDSEYILPLKRIQGEIANGDRPIVIKEPLNKDEKEILRMLIARTFEKEWLTR